MIGRIHGHTFGLAARHVVIVGARYSVAILCGGPGKGENNVGAPLVAAEEHVVQRERAGHRTLMRRTAAPRGEDHATPRLFLQEVYDCRDALRIAVLHVHADRLPAARDDHLVGLFAGEEPSGHQLIVHVDVVHRVTKTVVGDDHDIGALAKSQRGQLCQQQAHLLVVVADGLERLRRANAAAVLDVVGLRHPVHHHAGLQLRQDIVVQNTRGPGHGRIVSVGRPALFRRGSKALQYLGAGFLGEGNLLAGKEIAVDHHAHATRRIWRQQQRASGRSGTHCDVAFTGCHQCLGEPWCGDNLVLQP